MRNKLFTRLLGLVMIVSPIHGYSAEKKSADLGSTQDKMMAMVMKYASPNENHKVLDAFVGTWKHKVLWWMTPDSPPEVTEGININHWILGGRFLQQDVKGNSDEKPFEGMGFTGYDNVRGEYVSMWIDSMGTGMMRSTAQYDAATRTFSETGLGSCPMTGEKERKSRANWKIVDPDHYTYVMYSSGPDGKEFKTLEIHYTRDGK